jgi:hypothetical protein
MVSHKELRFLFPMIYLVPWMLAFTLQTIHIKQWISTKYLKPLLIILFTFNSLVLVYKANTSAHYSFDLMREVQKLTQGGKITTIICTQKDEEYLKGMQLTFYQPIKLKYQRLDNDFQQSINNQSIYFSTNFDTISTLPSNYLLVYSFPLYWMENTAIKPLFKRSPHHYFFTKRQ